MNALLSHYDEHGSATGAWIRACRQIEQACDFAALGLGPLEPEALPVITPGRARTEWSEEWPPDDITGQVVP